MVSMPISAGVIALSALVQLTTAPTAAMSISGPTVDSADLTVNLAAGRSFEMKLAVEPSISSPVESPSEFAEPAPLVPENLTPGSSDSTAVETANYSDGDISIDYPATWEVAVDGSGDLAIANRAELPVNRVETQLFRVAAPPGPLVNANIDSFIEEGAAVSRYRSVTIDEQSALVMWLADRPETLSSAIATFIGYGDNTIMLFSRYDPENTTAEDSILRLHSSFTHLSAPDVSAPVPSAPEPSELDSFEIDSSESDVSEIDDFDLERESDLVEPSAVDDRNR